MKESSFQKGSSADIVEDAHLLDGGGVEFEKNRFTSIFVIS